MEQFSIPTRAWDKAAKCMSSSAPCPGHRWQQRGRLFTLTCTDKARRVLSLTSADERCTVRAVIYGKSIEDNP